MGFSIKTIFGFTFLTFTILSLTGQEISNKRGKTIPYRGDSVRLDTITVIPSSINLKTLSGKKVSRTFYRLNPTNGYLIWKKPIPQIDSLKANYRVFPFSLTHGYYNKSKALIDSTVRFSNRDKVYRPGQKRNSSTFHNLERNGNISRGIRTGNNQDLSLNSNLDLQLTGNLTEEISINAAVTDQNLPIQPDGNSAQLQDFDRVFIELATKDETLNLGDFRMDQNTPTHFLNFSKKTQGIGFGGKWDLSEDKKLKAGADLGFSRGKFARNKINAREGDQGPYQLRGNEEERYIVIVAGSEKVFLNGEKLKRGRQHDYTIDYNSGEITFTNQHLINQYDRIIVEFQYAKRNYERSIGHTYGNYSSSKWNVSANIFSEQDHKNSPLFQNLGKEEKVKLASVGDSLDNAIIGGESKQEYNEDRIMYKKIDTLGYKDIYVYTTNPEKGNYTVQFSNVGRNNGNYRKKASRANGRVYKWVKPKNGIPQGRYAPIKTLVTPKKQQMVSVRSTYNVSENMQAGVEYAGSNRDVNTFSPQDNENDKGQATKAFVNKTFLPSNKPGEWEAKTSFSYEYTTKAFNPVERFRPIEFQRSWENTLNNNQQWEPKTQRLVKTSALIKNNKNFDLNYGYENFSRGTEFKGSKHKAGLEWQWKDFNLDLNNNITTVRQDFNGNPNKRTTFWEQKGKLTHQFGNIVAGGGFHREESRTKTNNRLRLDTNSYQYREWHLLAKSPDTMLKTYQLKFSRRKDFLPANNEGFSTATRGTNINFKGRLKDEETSNYLDYNINYRRFKLQDSTFRRRDLPKKSLTGALQAKIDFLDNIIKTSSFYELGAGKEQKREYQFIRVRADGRGNYVWEDYNNNGAQELNEFQKANEANDHRANFVRIITPSNEFIRSITNELRETINIEPGAQWRDAKGIKRLASRFSNETNLRINRKVLNRDNWQQYVPINLSVADSNLVKINSELRNTFYFNRNNSTFSLFYRYRNQKRKSIRVRGIDQSIRETNTFNGRVNFSRTWSFSPEYTLGRKRFKSEFFPDKNYNIYLDRITSKLNYQPLGHLRISLSYENEGQQNQFKESGEKATKNKIGLESNYSFIGKGSIRANLNYIHFDYVGETNTPVAYEMLKGLNAGQNWTWFLSSSYNLGDNIQLNISYNGRTSKDNPTIHQANVSARYLF